MKETALVKKAAEFSKIKHAQSKKPNDDDGKPHWDHVAKVAEILKLVTDDEEIIAAGYLHDTLEDTDTTYFELTQNFGKRVADLVNEVTKGEGAFKYFPRLKSRDAVLIKFADRLHNLSRMDSRPKDKQEEYLKNSIFWKSIPELKNAKNDTL